MIWSGRPVGWAIGGQILCTFAINLQKYNTNTCYVETFYICVRMSHPNQRGGGEWIWTLAVNTFPGFHPRPQSRDQQDARLRRGQTELVTKFEVFTISLLKAVTTRFTFKNLS